MRTTAELEERLARKVLAGEPVDLATGQVNVLGKPTKFERRDGRF
ncbi:hypothetical protein [Nonomuraea basaltis]|nr:hypothetical protein [Nonomuraea basaltis]